MILVESYVAGRWQGPAGARTELLNASTAEPVAVIGTDPIDMVPVLDHARSVGGPALRDMPFHERPSHSRSRRPPERQTRAVLRHLGA